MPTKKIRGENYEAWAITIVIIAFFIVAYGLLTAQIEVEMDCEAQISYENVEPYNCWMPTTSPEKCPLPTNMKCDIKYKAPAFAFFKMMD